MIFSLPLTYMYFISTKQNKTQIPKNNFINSFTFESR